MKLAAPVEDNKRSKGKRGSSMTANSPTTADQLSPQPITASTAVNRTNPSTAQLFNTAAFDVLSPNTKQAEIAQAALGQSSIPQSQYNNRGSVGKLPSNNPLDQFDLFSAEPGAPAKNNSAAATAAFDPFNNAADPFSAAFSNKVSINTNQPAASTATAANEFDPFAAIAQSPTRNSLINTATSAATSSGSKPIQQSQAQPQKSTADDSSSSSSDSDSDSDSSSSSSSSSDSSDSESGNTTRTHNTRGNGKEGAKKKKKKAHKGKSAGGGEKTTKKDNSSRALASGVPKGGITSQPGYAAAAKSIQTIAPAATPGLMRVDVLQYMKRGTSFLKYGKTGYPHFRQFSISADNRKLVWFSQGKKLNDTSIDIMDIEDLVMGQTTAVFARHKAPELNKSSFSIFYQHGKTLDLIAKDPNDFKIWTEGLRVLIDKSRSSTNIKEYSAIPSIILDLAIQPNRRSSAEITDLVSGKTAAAMPSLDGISEDNRPRALSTGNKQMYKEVNKNFSELKRKLAKRQLEMQSYAMFRSPVFDQMELIVKRVQESINKINDWFTDGEYPACDDEIWRAGVDLESLKNMIKSLKGNPRPL